ncbi:DUF349 domain-containing protein [Solicola sp. PLA-1-18]|uniref:DUF349 domain-containing protein n=1 Tax=Solicola sp. PLA-1-18 TaxID=3380532 RepID=UPI003B8257AB
MSAETSPEAWGRIDDQGTVYVRTKDGERMVGQWPDGDPAEAMALYTRRYDGLAVEVELLEKRVESGALGPDEAGKAVALVRSSVADAQAVGDLDGLLARIDALAPAIDRQREAKRAARAERLAEATTAKTRIVEEAETLAAGQDWKSGADRLRALLEEWKALPRLDRGLDDELWHRFSSARTTYTRHRKSHFAEQASRRDEAQAVKARLVAEAEAIQDSTDWGATAGAYRDLMRRWKAAGPAPRGTDEKLWRQFRAAQDHFFSARDETNAKIDAEFGANAEVKRQILVEAEALDPEADLASAKAALRDLSERWEAAGKVPRADMKELEGRMRAVENAVRDAEQSEWDRTNPEARARADETVTKLERSIADLRADLTKAEAAGKAKRVQDLTESIEAREAWLDQARRALSDFS